MEWLVLISRIVYLLFPSCFSAGLISSWSDPIPRSSSEIETTTQTGTGGAAALLNRDQRISATNAEQKLRLKRGFGVVVVVDDTAKAKVALTLIMENHLSSLTHRNPKS